MKNGIKGSRFCRITILEYPQKDVDRLLMMKKEEIKDWVEDHWQDEN